MHSQSLDELASFRLGGSGGDLDCKGAVTENVIAQIQENVISPIFLAGSPELLVYPLSFNRVRSNGKTNA